MFEALFLSLYYAIRLHSALDMIHPKSLKKAIDGITITMFVETPCISGPATSSNDQCSSSSGTVLTNKTRIFFLKFHCHNFALKVQL